MPRFLVQIEDAHLRELRQRFWRDRIVVVPVPENIDPESFRVANGPWYIDQDGEVDAFVRRCIGTVLELEEHRSSGGALFVQRRDGSVHELVVDASKDGMKLSPESPPPSAAALRRFRRGPRRTTPDGPVPSP